MEQTGNNHAALTLIILTLLLTAVLHFNATAETGDPIADQWIGRADHPDGFIHLELELTVERGQWQAMLRLPRQGGFAAAADEITRDGNILRMHAMSGRFHLQATVDAGGDSIRGTLEVDGKHSVVHLVRAGTDKAEAMKAGIQDDIDRLRSEPLELVSGSPERRDIDGEALEQLLEAARASHTTALAIMHNGHLVGEWYRGGERRRMEAMSVTKAVLNLVIGRLITLDRIESIDTPVHTFYPEWREGDKSDITLHHLLTHTSGLEPGMPTTEIYQSGNFIQHALNVPMESSPGSEVRYNNNTPNLLADIADSVTERSLEAFLREDLFANLDISNFDWNRDPAGNFQGMAGLQLEAGDLARLGQLVLNKGRWDGEQLIDSEWLEQSLRPGSAHSSRIGLLWFLIRDGDDPGDEIIGAMHSGHLGQYLVVYSDKQLVGVRMVQQSPAYTPETDSFKDFPEQLARLAPET